MQVNSSQSVGIQNYVQTQQNDKATAAAATNAATSASTEAAASSTNGQNVDRAEFSKDASITKMSAAERKALVKDLKADLNNQMDRFTNMMVQTFQKQGITANLTQGDDFWKVIASGNFQVDAQTKADAQAAISEDGYWGVSQTSQRIFDFAQALAGDDVKAMEKYQKAVEKGFKQAGAAWGGDLPSISNDTYSATQKLFDEYYAQHSEA